jgi:parallel beta-helix repeat protein
MKNISGRKYAIFSIIILFISAGVMPSFSSNVIDIDNLISSTFASTQQNHSVPRVKDNSGNTTFYGLFVGTSAGNTDRFGGEADRINDSLDGPGWDDQNSTTLENESATKENITSKIDDLIEIAIPGDEVVIYFITHGNNDHAKDGEQDPWEDDVDPKDEPDKFDNYIVTSDGKIITDDELTMMISGFEKSVTITIIIDACYSGTFTDGTSDLPHAKNGELDDEEYGDDHLAVLTSGKGTTPAPNDPSNRTTFTDKIIEGLSANGTTTKADKNNDGVTTSKELAVYTKMEINSYCAGDEDGDGLVDEDDIDYYINPNTGEISFLRIDNDGDGLINEDIAPTNPVSWYRGEWYVDDDASSGGNGSINNPFNTIEKAIYMADEGNRIYVKDGTYHEHIEIEIIQIELIGDYYGSFNPNNKKTVIDGGGSGNVISVIADGATISGFVIQGCGDNEEDAAIDLRSDYNFIYGNLIVNNGATGIYLHDSANNNYIYQNTMQENDGAGIFVWQSSNNNFIYHNNFINNGWFNAKDKSSNTWDDGYPSGGNYWDDYTGNDDDGDGIGDTPHHISDDTFGGNKDRYPFMNQHGWNKPPNKPEITGPTSGKAGVEHDYTFDTVDPNGDKIYFEINWDDNIENEYSEINSGRANVKHTWDEEGTYNIKVRAVDTYNAESTWSDPLIVTMPKSNNQLINLFLQFLENHPIIYRILQLIT